MKHLSKRNVRYYSRPFPFYDDLIKDINKAKRFVFIETYKIGEVVSVRLRDALIKAVKRGVEVKLLLDHWGSLVSDDFFKEVEDLGGEVRFFRVFKVTTNLISYNNRRDHRKIAVVDDVCFIGSANIADYCRNWREFIVRIRDENFASILRSVFLDNFKIHSFFFHSAKRHLKPLRFDSLEVVRDVPSLRYQRIRNKHLHLIRNAKREVVVETPYFVPDTKTLFALIGAAKRGVDVKLIIPKKSDVRLVDVLAQSLFGELHKRGVKIFLFTPGFSHAKVSLVDGKFFSFGSANFDYRSFKYQYEVAVFGDNVVLRDFVKGHLDVSLKNTEEFDFSVWKRRPLYKRVLEIVLEPFRYFF